jgi:uncharacterized protein YlzI (FlbEa/FlbD family)
MAFVKLTQFYGPESEPIFVNSATTHVVKLFGDGSMILVGDNWVSVKEGPAEVINKIAEANRVLGVLTSES